MFRNIYNLSMFDNEISNYEMFHIFRIGGSNISIRFLKKIGICYKKIISFSIFWEQTSIESITRKQRWSIGGNDKP